MKVQRIISPMVAQLDKQSARAENLRQCGGRRLTGCSQLSNSRGLLVTVVTVVFNDANALLPTILSVLNQSYPNVEYIIIDGGSADGTLDLLRKYENSISYWISETDMGVYDAFNKACRLLTGEWTIFLGAGDVLHDAGVLAEIAAVLDSVDEKTEIVYGKVCLNDSGKVQAKALNGPWSQMQGRWWGGRPMLPHHQGVFHRRCVLSVEMPFDITYRIAADSKLLYKSIKRAEPVFADVAVTSASLGGLSTDPKYALATALEIIRVNCEFGFTNYRHQFWCYLKAASKSAIYRFGGKALSVFCIDIYRRLTRRESIWKHKSDAPVS